jgi:hypothetical protein
MPTLTIAGTISFPLSDEASPPSRPFSAQLVYTERSVDDFKLVGAQADIDLMGAIADAKAVYVEAIAGDGVFKVNGAAVTIPLESAGGFYLWFNPSGGLTALTVTTTDNATFRVYVFA